jgi:uncharacterized protein YegP (UPF0339 family)
MAAKFTVYLDRAKKFRFNLKATNGEIIASGEAYEDKKACLRGIASIQKNAATAKIIDETVKVESAKKPLSKAKAAPKKAITSKDAPKKRGRKPKVI